MLGKALYLILIQLQKPWKFCARFQRTLNRDRGFQLPAFRRVTWSTQAHVRNRFPLYSLEKDARKLDFE